LICSFGNTSSRWSAAAMAGRTAYFFALLAFASVASAPRVTAQLVPNDSWKTLETRHFRIHFTPPLEEMARRAAPSAERAFELLSRELVPPRGKVDLVIADNVDYTNGYATPFPSNRIVIFAHPPVDETALRNYADWSALVITHELTHIFHLDRAAGIWRLGRFIFGRHPALFPNAYMPTWVIEGLAVYYESRLTGTGRLEGSEHYMIARAAAQEGEFPRLGEISAVTSRFPGGETVYAYGAFIFDYLSRTRGERTIRDFIELSSGSLFPLTLNGKSRKAFGISFERAWKQWTDSLIRTTSRSADPIPGWRQLTPEGWFVSSPRWLDDSTLVYGASTGRDVSHAYAVDLSGKEKSLGRRNGVSLNVRLPNGDLLFSQPDFLDPYRLRNDLYVQRGGKQIRLTHGARLSSPDARNDGAIVAVQDVPGSTRLVRVSPDGKRIVPITGGALDEQWLEPRWSPEGARIAAVRLPHGNRAEIVIVDTLGAVRFSYQFVSAIPATPSWSRDGTKLYFSSDHSGTMQLYALVVPPGGSGSRRLSDAVTGVFAPELSPDGRVLAALFYRVDGFHIGVAPVASAGSSVRDTAILGERAGCLSCRVPGATAYGSGAPDNSPATTYSPWRSLLPTYWEPVVESTTGVGTSVGGATSGTDIIGRHSYVASATLNTKRRETQGFAAYRYSGLGQPYVDLSAEQSWDHSALINSARAVVGDLAQRSRIYSAATTFTRPRIRTFASLSVGGEIETRDYVSDPDTLISRLPKQFSQVIRYPSVFTTVAWSNTRRPQLSISREDGFALSVTARQRWRNALSGDADTSPTRSIVGALAAFKALDFSGFAHHVMATRFAAGYADQRAISAFSVGGLSGTSLQVLTGVSVGGERRTFGVRGFPPSAEQGIRAFTGSLEYRLPMAAPSRHVRFIPILFDRFSATAFADAGRAYCPRSAVNVADVCGPSDADNPWLVSAGGEVNLDAALYYDIPARIRLGVAAPIANRDYARANAASVYLTFGSSF
jgi:hypothetical protein